jgi:alpha-N-arabinofuranosidase
MNHLLKSAANIAILSVIFFNHILAQTADNGDGTFTNPVLWGDFPDPDVIRVGNTYYMVSTSMHYFPGVTLMESLDLVNWNIASNVVDEFKEHPFYDLNGGNRYAKGQWATSLRYFNNKFYILFTTLTEGSYIYTSTDAKGVWEKHKLDAFLYDPGMFIDTDGRVYVVHGNTEIKLTELSADGLSVKNRERLIYKAHRNGLEGNRCYKIGDYYYIYCTYGGPYGNQVCLRSKSLTGPFEERVVMNDRANYAEKVIHQGCLVDLPDGSYWCVIFQDHGGLGRIPFLVPVYWADDWPLPGNPMDGNITLKKPVASSDIVAFPTTDEFDSQTLALQWQFNHNPDKTKYSLRAKKGSLRLHSATLTDSLMKAQNTICQRIFGPYSQATAKIDFSNMRVGDKAGLLILQSPFATMTIYKTKKDVHLQMTVDEEVKSSVSINESLVYLRAEVSGVSDKVNFSYSFDDKNYQPLGEEFKMAYSLKVFCGNRYGIFNYATQKLGGWIDVDWFRVVHKPLFKRAELAGKEIEAEYFDHQYRCQVRLSEQDAGNRNQDVVFDDGGLIAFDNIRINATDVQAFELTYTSSTSDATIEIRNADTGKVLGNFPLPATDGTCRTLARVLDEPLESVKRLELIIHKPRTAAKETVAIDKFKFASSKNRPLFTQFIYEGNDRVYKENPLLEDEFYSPILQGCYPDPSITRKGNDYYLVCSSFAFFPGVPVFHSTDLVNWKQTGHVLDRPSQLKVTNTRISGGIYAPDIEYNPYNDMFYMITTQISGGIGNMVVKTKDPAKGWSEIIKLNFDGIDPALFFDDNGKAYIVHNDAPEKELYSGHRAIKIWEYDVENDKVIPGTDKIIVDGGIDITKKPIWIEGPHLYKKNGRYYLMCAEGGTGGNHSEVVFVSDNIMGTYIPAQKNPILTQRHLPADRKNKVDWVGHADLVETPEGNYYGVFLGIRPNETNRVNTGRETFLLPVDWSGEFPVFAGGLEPLPAKLKMPEGVTNKTGKNGFIPNGNFIFKDDFTAVRLDDRWIGVRGPAADFINITQKGLYINPYNVDIKETKPTSTLFYRQQHKHFTATVTMDYLPASAQDLAGIVCYQKETFNYVFGITKKNNDYYLLLQRTDNGESTIIASEKIDVMNPVQLQVTADGDKYNFNYSFDNKTFKNAGGEVSGDILSTDMAGGFTGSLIGLYATASNDIK